MTKNHEENGEAAESVKFRDADTRTEIIFFHAIELPRDADVACHDANARFRTDPEENELGSHSTYAPDVEGIFLIAESTVHILRVQRQSRREHS